ncbi:MAG: DNA mismatch repair endonuclease MutL [Muribaculaceae bacterium]|nr:DNA mismatch repair endonuclease MutL [Muribaculaceae bacterium]
MSDIIKLLPDSVANLIAAGEVIQRPASVIKELVENAVDAGATSVKIYLKDAGRTLIQVIDNGCGMSDTDARLAFERHSTSKITEAADLFDLHTMGFRGEALASIAAAAQVELRTRRSESPLGTRIIISASQVESQEPDGCPPGTNMMIRNLFFNFPARRKFLKKDSIELSHILHEFERLALVNPDVEMMISHNDSVIHQLMKAPLKRRIGDLFGRTVEGQLLPVSTSTGIVTIEGFIGHPGNARRRGALQYLFVNGRNMRHPYFHKAVMSCYESLIRPDEQPNYFLNFTVDPSTIDVNIHPTKNEIKFEHEQSIWQIISAAVRETLGKFNVTPAIDFDAPDPGMPDIIPADVSSSPASIASLPHDGASTSYNPFTEGTVPSRFNWQREAGRATSDWEKLYDRFSAASPEPADTVSSILQPADVESPLLPPVPSRLTMQLKDRYILSPSREGLLIIDRYRAHVRVLFDDIYSRISSGDFSSQHLMFPETITLLPAQNVILDSIIDDVTAIGFDISFLGDNQWSILAVPSVVSGAGGAAVLQSIVDTVSEGIDESAADGLRRSMALAMARSSAIRAGQQMSEEECEHLLSRLFSLSTPARTPDGLPVISTLSLDEISSRLS